MSYAVRSIVILGVVGVIVVSYLFFTYRGDNSGGVSENTTAITHTDNGAAGVPNTSQGASVGAGAVTELDPSAIAAVSLVEDRSVSQPDIDREAQFNSSLEELKELMAPRFARTRARLHDEPYSVLDWLDLAIHYKTVDDFAGAEEVWQYLTLASPNNSVPFNNLGDLYHYHLRDFPKAEKYMKFAIEKANDPSYFINLFNLYTLSYKTDTNLGEQALLSGLQLNKGNINILMTLAKYYEDTDEDKKALERYKEARTHAQLIGNEDLVATINTAIMRLES